MLSNKPISKRTVMNSVQSKFRERFHSRAEMEAQELLSSICGQSWGAFMAQLEQDFPLQALCKVDAYVQRRLAGEPLAYILEEVHFFGSVFFVDRRVLIPRPETELLVEKALELIPNDVALEVADLGCGSGCIGLSIAKYREKAFVELLDSSDSCVEVAMKNRKALGLEDNTRVTHGKVGSKQKKVRSRTTPLNLIVANPPYIAQGDSQLADSVLRFEPHEALFADCNGYFWIENWLAWADMNLGIGGEILMEVGAGQAEEVVRNHNISGLKYQGAIKDYHKIDRILHFQKG